ncbi:hypothetical protein BX600DRAFT_435225 [Xylariales sp. PMI_506]|nr:hypothetical protein BX600DRAFT_435225 [Xylariales sp. PMI_506]
MSVTSTAPLAALTTIFTPSCSTSWLLATTSAPSQYPPFPTTGPASCDPPLWTNNIAERGFDYYSPAICPSGFIVGPNCGLTVTRTDQGFPAVQPGETVAYCVPSGQTCVTDVTDFRGGVWGVTVAPTGAFTVGPAIQIRWRDADLSILETHPLTPGLVLAGSTTTSASIPSVTTSASTDSTSVFTFITLTANTATTVELSQSTSESSSQSSASSTTSKTSASATTIAPNSAGTSASSLSTSSSDATGSSPATPTNKWTPGNIVAVVLSSLVAAIIVSLILHVLFKHYRSRYTSKQDTGFVSIGTGVWLRRGPADASPLPFAVPKVQVNTRSRPLTASSSGDDDAAAAELEAGTQPLGTNTNPAELDGTGDNASRWSWMSQVSKLFTVRSRATARSSLSTTTESIKRARSTASQRTSYTGQDPSDWETFVKEKWPDGLGVPAVPEAPRGPLPPRSPGTPKTLPPTPGSRDDWRRLNRASDGTFGPPPRSPSPPI